MLYINTTDNNCAKNITDISDDSEEKFSARHYTELSRIANVPLSDLAAKNSNLLVFPASAEKSYGAIGDQPVFEMYGSSENLKDVKIKTGNLMGFVGTGSTQIQIASRFSAEPSAAATDFFLHYMLAKVFCPNFLSLKTDFNLKSGLDYLCFLFPFYLKNAMSQGILKTYRRFERNDANVRGVIDVPRHIRKNIPFAGKISYTERTRDFDNPLTELVRHTVEAIKRKTFAGKILTIDESTMSSVSKIVELTPGYNFFEREKIISRNLKSVSHPYFTKWLPLQKLCLAILRYEKIRFENDSKKVCGLLFDGAWLWEEYLNVVLKPLGFVHPQNRESRGGIKVFNEKFLYFFPDFYRNDFVLDAKYKNYGETCVQSQDYHQIISYMHLLKSNHGGFLFPAKNDFYETYTLFNSKEKIKLIGLKIPQNAQSFSEFCEKMKAEEQRITSLL